MSRLQQLHRSSLRIKLERSSATLIKAGRPIAVRHLEPPESRPVFKWAGGKQWLAPLLAELTPVDWSGCLLEPFVGAGALFFALGGPPATLGDLNSELIRAYRGLRSSPAEVIERLQRRKNSEHVYKALAVTDPATNLEAAERMIYLNRTSFNGIYRVNKRGIYNVPFGKYDRPLICDSTRLTQAATALKNALLLASDFEETAAYAEPGDLVYADPPYITGHTDNGFLKYNKRLFSWDDEHRLAAICCSLVQRGVHVVLSHADFAPVLDLYPGFFRYTVTRASVIAGAGGRRGRIREALLVSYPLFGVE